MVSIFDLPIEIMEMIPLDTISRLKLRSTCTYMYNMLEDTSEAYRQCDNDINSILCVACVRVDMPIIEFCLCNGADDHKRAQAYVDRHALIGYVIDDDDGPPPLVMGVFAIMHRFKNIK